MLVSTGPVPRGALWELKWDGFRCIVGVDGQSGLRVSTRSGRLVHAALPELADLAKGDHEMVLDGELVAGDGMPASFYVLARRLNVSLPEAVARAARSTPITLVIFDILWLDGHLLVDHPYRARREVLEDLHLRGSNWVTPRAYDDGEALLEACTAVGAEGAVAKAGDSRYLPGVRSAAWVKRKCERWKSEHARQRRPGS